MRFVVDYGKQNEEALDACIALTAHQQTRSPGRVAVKVAGWIGTVLGGMIVVGACISGWVMLGAIGLVLAGASFLCMQISTQRALDAARKEQLAQLDTALVTGKHTYEVDADGLRISTGRGPRVLRWSELCAWGSYTHYRFVRGAAGEFVLFDVARLKDEQVEELDALLAEHLGEEEPAGVRV